MPWISIWYSHKNIEYMLLCCIWGLSWNILSVDFLKWLVTCEPVFTVDEMSCYKLCALNIWSSIKCEHQKNLVVLGTCYNRKNNPVSGSWGARSSLLPASASHSVGYFSNEQECSQSRCRSAHCLFYIHMGRDEDVGLEKRKLETDINTFVKGLEPCYRMRGC